MTILDAIRDRELFGPWFGDSWRAWFTFLAALFALPFDGEDQAVLLAQCTGRTAPPTAPAREGWVIVGRRGGKSLVAALVAVYLACFRDYSEPTHLARSALVRHRERFESEVRCRFRRTIGVPERARRRRSIVTAGSQREPLPTAARRRRGGVVLRRSRRQNDGAYPKRRAGWSLRVQGRLRARNSAGSRSESLNGGLVAAADVPPPSGIYGSTAGRVEGSAGLMQVGWPKPPALFPVPPSGFGVMS